MKAWFENLAARERLLVTGAGIVLLLLLMYLLTWAPLYAAYQSRRDAVAEQRETAAWMQASAQQLAQLRRGRGGQASTGLGGQSLLAMTDSSARQAGLGTALKRVEPDGSNSVKVWMDGAAFDDLLRWLVDLNNSHGVTVDTVTLERVTDVAGRVNVRLTLQAPES